MFNRAKFLKKTPSKCCDPSLVILDSLTFHSNPSNGKLTFISLYRVVYCFGIVIHRYHHGEKFAAPCSGRRLFKHSDASDIRGFSSLVIKVGLLWTIAIITFLWMGFWSL